MIEYLPHVLREYQEMKGIMDGQQWLFTLLWDEMERIFENQFIETADAGGLERWERMMQLYPKGSDSLEERCFRIKTKWNQGQLPYTYRTLQQYLATVSGDFETRVDHNAYALFLRVRLEGFRRRDALAEVLRKMIPANITFGMKTEIPQKIRQPQLTIVSGMRVTVRHRHKGV